MFEHIGGCPSIGTTLTTITPACRVLIELRPRRERERMLCKTDCRAHHPGVGVWEVRWEHICPCYSKGFRGLENLGVHTVRAEMWQLSLQRFYNYSFEG